MPDLTDMAVLITGAARGQGRAHAVKLSACGADAILVDLAGLTKALAAELGRHRIRVNCVHPGSVPTPMGSGRMVEAMSAVSASNPQLRNGFSKQLIPDVITMPEDVAEAVAWLASTQSRSVTAAALSMDVGAAPV